METKIYHSELRALLSIRNFDKALEKHYEQMRQIEKSLDKIKKDALSLIETHCSKEAQENWENGFLEVCGSVSSVNRTLKALREKIVRKERTDSSELWKQYDLHEHKLKESYRASEKLGFEILPESEHEHWQKDICNFEETILSLVISHSEACKLELEIIEKYTPKELNELTQLIVDHIPEDFTFEEADKYELEYLNAVEEMRKEFGKKENLWDKIMDILAGGTHQPPSERVMMKRWINGEKENL